MLVFLDENILTTACHLVISNIMSTFNFAYTCTYYNNLKLNNLQSSKSEDTKLTHLEQLTP